MDSLWQIFKDVLFGPDAAALEVAVSIVAGVLAIIGAIWAIFKFLVPQLSRKVPNTRAPQVPETEQQPQPDIPKGPRLGIPGPGRRVRGREAELADLHNALASTGEAAIVNSHTILKAHGGYGKTTLARHYVERHGESYFGILWCDAKDQGSLVQSLHKACPALGREVPAIPELPSAEAVVSALDQSGDRWLLIYDNVETYSDIKTLVPPSDSSVRLIVTTREATGFTGFAQIEIKVLDFETEDSPALTVLMDAAERDQDAAGARDLAKALGGMPLALTVAGAIAKRSGETWAEIGTQIDRVIAAAPKNETYEDSVIGAVGLSYEKLGPDARLVADLFAWWAPEGLVADLITAPPKGQNWPAVEGDVRADIVDLAKDPTRVAAAVDALQDGSLITKSDAGGFAMHRMTAAALRAMQDGGAVAESATALLAATFPENVHDPSNWDLCRVLTPHVRALWASGQAPLGQKTEYLLNQSGGFLVQIADYVGGLELRRAALDLTLDRVPEEHRDVALAHANYGTSLLRNGQLEKAETQLRKAVELDKIHRAGTVDLAESYDLLGGLLLDIGQKDHPGALREALKSRQSAAAIFRRHFGRQSDARAGILNNIGAVRSALGQKPAAARLYQASLSIRRDILPSDDVRLTAPLTSTAAMYLRSGQADQAEPLLEEALQICRNAFPEAPKHPNILNTAGWLVSCLLVRATAGENTGLRDAKAKQLCDEFGWDFDDCKQIARQYSYSPTKDTAP